MIIVREPSQLPTQLVGTKFAFDTETTHTRYDVLETVGVSLSDGKMSWYIPVMDIGGTVEYPLILAFLKCLFGNRKSVAIAHNAKFDLKVLRKMGVEAKCTVEDTLLASWLLDERSGRHGLKFLGREILKDDPPELPFSSYSAADYAYNRVKTKKTATSCTRWNIKLAEYAATDALNTYRLWDWWFQYKLKDFTALYEEMEKPSMRVLLNMETAGVTLDKVLLSRYKEEIEHERLPVLKKEIQDMTWPGFNINSNRDMQQMLFKKLGLRSMKKTNTGQPSVDKEVLEYYSEEPFTKRVLEFRALEKLLNTYIVPLLQVNGNKVYCNFNLTTTVTGRLCVSKDTLVEAPRDLSLYPEGLPITELKEGDLVYSYTWDKRLCLRKIKWVGRTGYKPTVTIRAKGEKGDIVELRLTSDHLVRMYDGRWQAAGYLRPGNRLMCMVRRGVSEGYAHFFPSSRRRNKNNPSSTTGGKVREHRYIVAQMQGLDTLPSKWAVHHKDGNTLNNHPSNLEQIMHSSHKKMHRPKTTPEQVQDMLDGAPLTIHPRTLKRLSREYGLYPTNHTVIEVIHNKEEEVWDLEVEDTHTFIANGIAVHNSSSEPNLQNIPAAGDEFNIRKAFIPSTGNKLVVADYSSLELRILAHFISTLFSGHSYLREAFDKELDAHKYMASILYGIEYEEVTPQQRKTAKSTTFGIIYGMGPRKLGKELGIKMKEAQEFLQHYYQTFPEIKLMQSTAIDSATKQGYVNTLFGHRRRFYTVKDSPQTQALNALIQGTAAEIVKLAQIRLEKELPRGCHQIIQVHDEVVVDAPVEVAEKVAKIMTDVMENTTELELPLKVDPKIVDCWAEAK